MKVFEEALQTLAWDHNMPLGLDVEGEGHAQKYPTESDTVKI